MPDDLKRNMKNQENTLRKHLEYENKINEIAFKIQSNVKNKKNLLINNYEVSKTESSYIPSSRELKPRIRNINNRNIKHTILNVKLHYNSMIG